MPGDLEAASLRFARIGVRHEEVPVVIVEHTDDIHDLRPLTDDLNGAFWASGGTVAVADALATGRLPLLDRRDFAGPPERWLEAWSQSGSGHHFAMGAGHVQAEVQELARLLNVDCLVVSAA